MSLVQQYYYYYHLAGKICPVVSKSSNKLRLRHHKLIVKPAYPGIYHQFVKNMLLFQHPKILILCSTFRHYVRSEALK